MNRHLITAVWISGHPATKGSLTFKGRGHVQESVKGSEEWRSLVTNVVRNDIRQRSPNVYPGDDPPTTLPVLVRLGFWLDHPDPCGATVRAGDIDKLTRNVLDALTDAGAYVDDNQVAQLSVTKLSSGGHPGESGVHVEVIEIEPARMTRLRTMINSMRYLIRGH